MTTKTAISRNMSDIEDMIVPGGAENQTISHIIYNRFKKNLETGYFIMPDDSPFAEIFHDMDFDAPLKECTFVSREEYQVLIRKAGLHESALILPFEDFDLALRLQFTPDFPESVLDTDNLTPLNNYIRTYLSKIIKGHTTYLNVLNNMSQIMLSSMDIEAIFPVMVKEVSKLVNFNYMSLVTYHPEFDSFRLEAEYNNSDGCSFKKQFIKSSETSLARLLVRTNGLVASLKDIGQGVIAQRMFRMGYQSFVFNPIYDKAELLATVNLASRDVDAYSKEHVKVLSRICNIVGSALKSATNHHHLQQLMNDYDNAKKHFMQLEKSRNFIDITRGVLHAFNNHLALIMGRAQILRQFSGDVIKLENARKGLDIILNASTQASEQIAELQKYARLRPDDDPDQIQLKGLIEEIIELSMPRWKAIAHGVIEFRINIDTQLIIKGYRKKLKEALINILMNAVEAEEEHGGEISINAHAAEDMAVIRIKDQGIGIEKDAIPRVFNPFYSTKPDGTGLGLAVSYRIIKEHSGKLDIESSPGKGTTVTIKLPLKIRRTRSSFGNSDSRLIKNIVVVDQNRIRRHLLSSLLGNLKLKVKAAKSLSSVDSIIVEEKPDLVILDDELEEVNPVEYFAMIKSKLPEISTCLVCASANAEEQKRLKALGIDVIITKPFEQGQIRETIDRLSRPTSRE
ncbi:MAG: response regulator [candidate division Zixibacteria bacterium]|nr:response regulator [candidate division Zixibacteria bacterium]NIR66537.1 response regulator [candidate division Zixibacteria bacterium]NIS17860.1 response regulator [candidate division Zixibacteria bacterium]NIS48099.1 response regulator [candidate division Zixibacteria bacterium]NIT54148.1 response regulator [candidate division Zixibacteria bacterium]